MTSNYMQMRRDPFPMLQRRSIRASLSRMLVKAKPRSLRDRSKTCVLAAQGRAEERVFTGSIGTASERRDVYRSNRHESNSPDGRWHVGCKQTGKRRDTLGLASVLRMPCVSSRNITLLIGRPCHDGARQNNGVAP